MSEDTLNSDLREEVLKYLKHTMEEPRPQFPTEYSALLYVALGTLKLLHESVTNYNMWAIQNEHTPKELLYVEALEGTVKMLEELAPQMQELDEPPGGGTGGLIFGGTGGFTL